MDHGIRIAARMLSYRFIACAGGLTLTAAAAVLACGSSDPTGPTDRNITLRVGERIAIARSPLVLTFVRVSEDSRCSPDVVCIWHGNATVELGARIGTNSTTVWLNTHVGPREGLVGAYRITLVDLTRPPPSNSTPPPDYYRATLFVTNTASGVCTEEARPGITVAVTDSLAGTAAFTDLSAVVRDGDYRDSVFQAVYPEAPQSGPLAFAYERAGTYTVTVRAAGYLPWVKAGVVVTRDACHVVTVPLAARMVR